MGIFKKENMILLLKILNFLFQLKTGELWISGKQEIFVCTGWTPAQVWINLKPPHSCGGSHKNKDKFDISIVNSGFIITFDIQGQQRQMYWIACKREFPYVKS